MVIVDGKSVEALLFDTRQSNALLSGFCNNVEGCRHDGRAICCDMTKSDKYGGSFVGQLPIAHARKEDGMNRIRRMRDAVVIYYIHETGEAVIPLCRSVDISPLHATMLIKIDCKISDKVGLIEVRE